MATRLAFTTEPANAIADTAMAADIRVSVLDQGGAVLATATPAVTLAFGENPGSATLGGATTVTAVAGVATFPGILLDRVGADYTLVATSPGLTPDTSATFTVTLSVNDADGDGYSPNAGDCDDFTPAIHPGATDFPDATYRDTNCDGTDGERANAAFVATTGVDEPSCGTEASPCATVQQGIDRAVALGRRDVYVVAGHYAGGAFTLADGVNVFGGFDPQYRRDPANVATITGRSDFPVDAGTQSLVVFASSLTLPTVVADLTLSGADAASRFGGGQGKSSYVIVARSIPAGVLTIARNVIVARNGLSGALGANGPNAATLSGVGLAGGAGGAADEFTTACNNTSRGLGGAAGAIGGTGGTVSTVPGAGGNGGTMDTDCNPFALNTTARPGANGLQAAQLGLVPSRGHGGVGGTGGDLCGLPQDGEPGTITNGAAGTGGGAGGRIIGGFWAARDGGDGALGDNGGGGGGGGGSG
ncbi:MAG: putative metal-binding motif-containing protein, partial [Gemmatimonadales bacterium]|nr:putative metal-binding motif-containing protein [Gemmatimonadales bacterium]